MANATNLKTRPHPDQQSKGAVQHGSGVNIVGTDIWLQLIANGNPVNGINGTGAGWAGKGSQLIDATTGIPYYNSNTMASPTCTAF